MKKFNYFTGLLVMVSFIGCQQAVLTAEAATTVTAASNVPQTMREVAVAEEAEGLLVGGAGSGNVYSAIVFAQVADVSPDSFPAPIAAGSGTAERASAVLELGSMEENGKWTKTGKFLIVLTETDANQNVTVKYKDAVYFSRGKAAVEWASLDNITQAEAAPPPIADTEVYSSAPTALTGAKTAVAVKRGPAIAENAASLASELPEPEETRVAAVYASTVRFDEGVLTEENIAEAYPVYYSQSQKVQSAELNNNFADTPVVVFYTGAVDDTEAATPVGIDLGSVMPYLTGRSVSVDYLAESAKAARESELKIFPDGWTDDTEYFSLSLEQREQLISIGLSVITMAVAMASTTTMYSYQKKLWEQMSPYAYNPRAMVEVYDPSKLVWKDEYIPQRVLDGFDGDAMNILEMKAAIARQGPILSYNGPIYHWVMDLPPLPPGTYIKDLHNFSVYYCANGQIEWTGLGNLSDVRSPWAFFPPGSFIF